MVIRSFRRFPSRTTISALGQIEILHAQTQSLQKPLPGSIQQLTDQALDPSHSSEDSDNLLARKNDRPSLRPSRPHDVPDPLHSLLQNLLVEEQKCTKCL